MALQRTPSKTAVPPHYGSDSTLYVGDSVDKQDYNKTKRLKRRLEDSTESSNSILTELRAMIGDLRVQQDSKLETLKTAMENIQEQNIDIKISLEFMSDKYDELLDKFNSLQQENSQYKSRITYLESKIEQFERKSRASSIEMRNVIKMESENRYSLIELTKNVGKLTDVPIQDCDIRDAFRMKMKQNINGPIIIDFTTTVLRDNFLKSAKSYNKTNPEQQFSTTILGQSGPQNYIFIGESLTPQAKRLHYLARDFAKTFGYKHCWTSYGKIYLRRSKNNPHIRIDGEEDLTKLKKSN
ncbi:unnamed protein product [Chilo suppressalis]|uniref:FP protein C-terminal domain-containing protein n=1 Tax=Chilo suppressalis TaxID=168631 RepID=A0ABN8APS3_CHISP|nr:unnamed protein product [Chilo suppressalis]